MQDLLLLLLPHLSPVDSVSLFQICLTQQVLGSKDNGIQKRGYKILAKLVESGKVPVEAESLLRNLDELSDGLSAAAKKVCQCRVIPADIHYYRIDSIFWWQ